MKTSEQYVKDGGVKCPACSSRYITGTGNSNADGDWHSETVECESCGATWDDIYTLSGYDGLAVKGVKK